MDSDQQDDMRFSPPWRELQQASERIQESYLLTTKERFELLVMSEAGKPIYSFSKRDDTVILMPLCSTLLNYARKAQRESLISMKTSDNLVISFTTRTPLIIIVVHETNYCIDPLVMVDRVEDQIISILTAKSLKSVFEDRPTFDLKRLLYGSEKLIDSIVKLSLPSSNRCSREWPSIQSFLAVPAAKNSTKSPKSSTAPTSTAQTHSKSHRILIPTVPMTPSAREAAHSSVSNAVSSRSKNIVFTLLFRVDEPNEDGFTSDLSDQPIEDDLAYDKDEGNREIRLITVCNHHPKHKITLSDIHIILALLYGSRAQLSTVESLWMPICLPKFNQDAFLHSYISYINETKHCIVMLSVDRDEFPNCQDAKNDIEEKVRSILKDQRDKFYYQPSPLVHPLLLELQDKLVGNTLSPEELTEVQHQSSIYNSKLELYHARQLQFLWYQTDKQVLWWQRSFRKPPSPVIHYVTKKMLQSCFKTLWLKLADDAVILGWHTSTFQLYAQFDGKIPTSEATEVIQRITSWIKKEEDNFSIKDYR